MVADGLHRRGDLVGQAIVDDDIDRGAGIAFLDAVKKICHGGAELIEIPVAPTAVLVVADRRFRPTVVRASENEDEVCGQ